MKYRILTAATVALSAVMVFASNVGAGDSIVWHARYQDALAEAKATGKPIFLAFRCVP